MDLRARIRDWLVEDFGGGPLHFEAAKDPWCEAHLRAKAPALLAGAPFLLPVFEEAQGLLALGRARPPEIEWTKEEGERVSAGERVAVVRGHAQTLLKAERTALNLLSHVSEIATHTAAVLKRLEGAPPTFRALLDTRKNRPGLRYFEKYAVRAGGGRNHRLGLFDGELIKDNDIAAAGSIPAAVDRCWGWRYMTDVQIEVQGLDQLEEVIADGRVHMILLDNMDLDALRAAVARAREAGAASMSGKPYELEASGVGGASLAEVAATGVDYISTSSLVRAAPPLDFHMKIVSVG